MRAAFKLFESYEETWDVLCGRAAAFATTLGPGRVISVSQTESVRSKRVVAVWYWEPAE